ncbi:MAG: hypothetical protein ETSY1_34405 [Candidatus Entotheonella factor]|uniref:Uncharacterized protein n=1 Tax=Entotheonella factor TaxID=1429438 RepID=W4LA15_ENTF1|nr:MAG: hypothetical protein ETSY1_34405 [Candidatus Entotheonella factor]
MPLITIIIVGIAAAIGVSQLRRLIHKSEISNRGRIEQWVDEAVARDLGQKLQKPPEIILKTFGGASNHELIAQIEEIIRTVEFVVSRLANNREAEIRLNINYKDGTDYSTKITRGWDELPQSIRSEFLKGGQTTVRRSWNYPWVS